MKVLHILAELKFSGAEIMYVSAAKEFQDWGCELYVVNTTKEMGEYAGHFKDAGYTVLHWPYKNGMLAKIKYYHRAIKYIKQNHIDVVHIHNSGMKFGMSYCAWRAGIKSIYTFHNVFISHWYSYLYHCWLRWASKNIFGCKFQTISDSVYSHELSYYNNKTIKVYNWYNNNKFYPANKEEVMLTKKTLGITDKYPIIISVGGCSPIKRHSDVLRCMADLLKDYPNAYYLHLGMGVSLKEEEILANELGITNSVRFCGNQEDVRKYLLVSDVYVMPSKHEGISLTTIEAMGTGIPSVLYDVPGLKDFNNKYECAIIIPEDYHLLASNIIRLYKDDELQARLKANGKKYVDETYNMSNNARKIYGLYL